MIMPTCDTKSVVDWLADGARSSMTSDGVLAELCDRLVQCGIPLWRVAVFVNTLHPEIMGRRFIWQMGAAVKTDEGSFAIMDTEEYRTGPFYTVITTGQSLRRRLADPHCPMDYALLHELRANGVTDYFAAPLIFTDGAVHVATWSTRQAGGFTDEQFAGLEAIIAPLSRVAEIRALRRTATNLLDTYVGHQAGERIWGGRIRRGHTEDIHAVIWLSDMRGFTTAADRLPPQVLVGLLNRYFDCQVPAIEAHGGEVLKFIGDGLLAIFPIAEGAAGTGDICRQALAAAREAKAKIEELGHAIEHGDMRGVRFGLALHLGHVLYGNIGSGNRLDFTCIGPAVNLAARLEKLAARLGRTLVTSADFAQHHPPDLERLGEFPIAGFAARQTAYGLRDEQSAAAIKAASDAL
jgi:adenylate cyclase